MPSSERRSRRSRAGRVTKRLEAAYGSPRLGNKDQPLDELIFIVLSQMTTGPSYERVFERLKTQLPSWDELESFSVSRIATVIGDAGLVNQKAPRLLAIARRLKKDFGRVTLDDLHDMPDADCLAYLRSLPGVGIKTAKCVMMYSLGKSVLPVDTHTARLGLRLGLVDNALSRENLAAGLEESIAPGDRYAFHVNAVAHGRQVCRATHPRCGECPIRSMCPARLTFTGPVGALGCEESRSE